ncbi:MAG: AraC family transcriptional regulator [bacterium]|nr:AraC family transcriptional regulator [bacterium]
MEKVLLQENILKNYPVQCIWQRHFSSSGNLAYHKEYEIHYIKRGTGYYFIENRKYKFTHNNFVVIKSGEIHRFIPFNPPVHIEKGTLFFSPSFINREIKKIIETSPHIIRLGEREATLVEIIFRNISVEVATKEMNWEEIVHYETMALISLLKRCSSKKNPVPRHNPRVESIMNYIEGHFTEDISLSDIAKKFFISESYLSHLFKNETGMPLKQYIFQRRIMEAKKLLTEHPEKKVYTVAGKVGFTDFTIFNRTFKKITGMTPSNYRRISLRR